MTAFRGVTKLLDDYAAKWAGLYRDACEATHVRGEQSEEVLDLRMGCLNERLVDPAHHSHGDLLIGVARGGVAQQFRINPHPLGHGAQKVERGRRMGSDLAWLITRRLSFGGKDVSPAVIEYLGHTNFFSENSNY